MTAREMLDRLLAVSLSETITDDLPALYADDVVFEFPYAPPGMPDREIGVEGLRARLKAGDGRRRYTGVDEVVVHEMPDPDELIAEWRLHGEIVATGEQVARRMLIIMRTRGDRIVFSRDYWDPAALSGRAVSGS